MMNYKYMTLSLDSPVSTLHNTGGKGHNLAILSRAAAETSSVSHDDANSILKVPPGFIVTVDAYRDFVAAAKRSSSLRDEMEVALKKLDAVGEDNAQILLDDVSETIRQAFRKQTVSATLKQEIASRLDDLILQQFQYVAVRSSATCEDMPEASFAGQHDTYLNVAANDIDNVCRHVVDCFASLFTSRAIAYRQRNGISHVQAGMAVVVQVMVPSESSGVLFTANPLTGRRTETCLEVIPGLGEALVSGLTEPDRYVVAREDGDAKAKIIDKRVGAKAKAICPVKGGGVIEENTEKQQEKALTETVLSDEIVLQLVELGQVIEELYDGKPQDIEWARAGSTTYVVQSRPITTLFPQPKPVIRDDDDPLSVYFSFGAVQGFNNPIYPAGQDAIRAIFRGMLQWSTWGREGKKSDFLQVIAERLYINVTRVVRNSVGRKFISKALTAVEPGIKRGLDEVVEDPRLEIDSGVTPVFFFRLLSLLSAVVPRYLWTFMFPNTSRQLLFNFMDSIVAKTQKKAEDASNLLQVLELRDTTFKGFFPVVIPRFIPRMGTAMHPLILLNSLASTIPDGKDLVLTITRGIPYNVTTEMDLKLWEVAKTIRDDVNSLELFHANGADSLAADYLAGRLPKTAQGVICNFMAKYGMRGFCEIDIGRPRWREEPAPLMQTLKSYVDIDDENAPDRVFARGGEAADSAIERLGQELGKPWIVTILARRVRELVGLRELPKWTIIRIFGIIRQKMLDYGEKLVQAGTLDSAHDLFVLHDDELKALARKEPRDWKRLVDDRKATMDRESERTLIPRVLLSDGFGFYGGAPSAVIAESDKMLVGEPVSPGSIEGRVRVVLDPCRTKLEPGEVLVCPGTDPSWTPLFLAASSLVMEVGGLMTHGSVVAREYGIPAVVGLEKVTERLKTGQLVRVDGSSGVVEMLEG